MTSFLHIVPVVVLGTGGALQSGNAPLLEARSSTTSRHPGEEQFPGRLAGSSADRGTP